MLRVLCLHDCNRCGYTFRSQLNGLEEILREKHSIELVFVDSPLCVGTTRAAGPDNEVSANVATNGELPCALLSEETRLQLQPAVTGKAASASQQAIVQAPASDITYYQREWFAAQPTEIQKYTARKSDKTVHNNCSQQKKLIEYIGLDASLFHLQQIWNRERSTRPFGGILAFGQGAALAGIVPLILQQDEQFMPGLNFMILVSGYVLDPPPNCGCRNVPPEMHTRQDGIIDSLTTLHIIGNSASNCDQSMRLARRFALPTIYRHSGDSAFPTRPRDFNVIGRFLVQRKRDLVSEYGSDLHEIIYLQRQLHLTEDIATQLVTKAVAVNPPKALMAIISPQAVGGWLGPKLRNPTDGGGAPCPSEFVMKRAEREQMKQEQEQEYPDADR